MLKNLLLAFFICISTFSFAEPPFPVEPKTEKQKQLLVEFLPTYALLWTDSLGAEQKMRLVRVKYKKEPLLSFLNELFIGKQADLAGDHYIAVKHFFNVLHSSRFELTRQYKHLINNYLGISLAKVGAFELSVKFNEESLKYLDDDPNNDTYYLHEDHALKLLKVERVEDAVFFFRKTLNMAIAANDTSRMIHSTGNVAHCYYVKGEPSKAIELYNEGVHWFNDLVNPEMEDSIQCAILYLGISTVLSNDKGYRDQLAYLNNGYSLLTGSYKHPQVAIQYHLAFTELHLALENWKKVGESVSELESLNCDIIELSRIKTRYFAGINDYPAMIKSLAEYEQLEKEKGQNQQKLLEAVNAIYLDLLQEENAEKDRKNKLIQEKLDVELQREVLIVVLFVLTLLFLSLMVIYYNAKRKRQRQVEFEKRKAAEAQLHLAHQNIEKQKQILKKQINTLAEKNKVISGLRKDIGQASDDDIKILTNDDWLMFKTNYEEIEQGLISFLLTTYPKMTDAELRLFLLIRLNYDLNAISNILGISKSSVQRSRSRLRKKMNLSSNEDLNMIVSQLFKD